LKNGLVPKELHTVHVGKLLK